MLQALFHLPQAISEQGLLCGTTHCPLGGPISPPTCDQACAQLVGIHQCRIQSSPAALFYCEEVNTLFTFKYKLH